MIEIRLFNETLDSTQIFQIVMPILASIAIIVSLFGIYLNHHKKATPKYRREQNPTLISPAQQYKLDHPDSELRLWAQWTLNHPKGALAILVAMVIAGIITAFFSLSFVYSILKSLW